MSRKTPNTLSILILLVAPALSGCKSAGLASFPWWHRRENAFAYAAPSGLPQPAVAASSGPVPQVAADTAGNPQENTAASPAPDPYAAGADEWAARSASASSGSGDAGYGSRGRSGCTSGCCSR